MVPKTTSASGVRAAAAFVFGQHGRGMPGDRAASAEAARYCRFRAVPSEQQDTLLSHELSCSIQKQVVRDAGKENFPVV
jgi:hypothetical protein